MTMWRCLVALGVSLVGGCGHAVKQNAEMHAVPTANAEKGIQLSLDLQVIADPTARGLDPPKALRVTLENSIQSQDGVFVNGSLPVRGGGADGVLQLELRSGNDLLENRCLVNAWSAQARDYVYLAPGSALTRVLKLGCYHPPSTERLSAMITYEDPNPPASRSVERNDEDDPLQQPCQAPPGLTPQDFASVFHGPVISNTVQFTVRDD